MASRGNKQNVRVFCRVRPTNQKEVNAGGFTCVSNTENTIEITTDDTASGKHKFSFDRIFGPDSTQVEVFTETSTQLVNDVLSGYNATIFAYGQTGTGKTHTMEGNIHSEEGKGIIPRTVEALFEGVLEADENIEFTFKVSYVEIYLERIRDLLDDHRVKVNLTVREDKIKGIYIAGVTEEYVTSVDELLAVMSIGATNRAVAATGMNEGSSRSHSVFTVTVGQKDVITNASKSGKLVLVDLAGSEMVRKSNASGQQLEEAKTINKSLSALGNVINALTDDKASHVPYRDSKLTRVLQDSLGGNSKTALVVAVSPSSFNAPETLSTLKFGNRAKSIKNEVKINQTRSIEELENLLVRAEKAIDAQTAHIISLSTQLQALQSAYQQLLQHNNSSGGGGGSNSSGQSTTAAADTDAASESTAARSNNSSSNTTTVELPEGKVVLDISKVEAEAAAMSRLQEAVAQLSNELDEERQEASRKDAEMKQLNLLLKEKERVMAEAATMLADVQRGSESLRERSEQLLREKIDAVGELESLKAQVSDALSKQQYELEEKEVELNTLRAENGKMKAEIAEMSGEGSNSNSKGKHKFDSPRKNNLISDGMGAADDADEETAAAAGKRNSSGSGSAVSGRSATAATATAAAAEKTLNAAERKQLLDEYSAQFATVCLQFHVDEAASSELFAVFDGYSQQQEKFFVAVEDKFSLLEKSSGKRIRDLEEQRARLEKDLQNRVENMVQLQIKFDALSRMDSKQLSETLSEKDRAQMKSLQQRLEQLVAVHRQLLRKFASLELETVELKKKTQLRDERIRQLEGNSRGLIGNIRQQAERHVAELTNLREQIQVLKAEHEMRLENYSKSSDQQSSSNATPRRNALNAHVPKSLRGGGGMARSFYDTNSSSSNNNNNSSGNQQRVGSSSEDPLACIPELDDIHISSRSRSERATATTAAATATTTSATSATTATAATGGGILKGPSAQPAASNKSSVFSRMLKGQQK